MCLGRYSTRLPERAETVLPTSNPERFCGARNSLEAEMNSDARCRSELAISASLLFSAWAASPIACVVYAVLCKPPVAQVTRYKRRHGSHDNPHQNHLLTWLLDFGLRFGR